MVDRSIKADSPEARVDPSPFLRSGQPLTRCVGLIGNLGSVADAFDGQTIRTRLVRDEFLKRLGGGNVRTADTALIVRRPWKVLSCILNCFREADVICIMPGERGLRMLIPLFLRLRRYYRRPVHYLVVGGWLPVFLEDKPRLCRQVAQLDGLHVQSRRMQRELKSLGMRDLYYLPNFRKFSPPAACSGESAKSPAGVLKLVFLSRVIPEKGLAPCVRAVQAINSSRFSPSVTLAIYGPVGADHQAWLDELLKICPASVDYCGAVAPDKVIGTLAEHDVLLFPTWYDGEGFPGVIVEAYAAGIPVIASDWQDNAEVVESGVTGQLAATGDENALREAIIQLLDNPARLAGMKQAARERARCFHVDEVIPDLLDRLLLKAGSI